MTALIWLLLLTATPLDASNWDTFAECVTGPGRGCQGYSYTRCVQLPGHQPACTEPGAESGSRDWRCDVHPGCLVFDRDGDLDIDLRDWAKVQLQGD